MSYGAPAPVRGCFDTEEGIVSSPFVKFLLKIDIVFCR